MEKHSNEEEPHQLQDLSPTTDAVPGPTGDEVAVENGTTNEPQDGPPTTSDEGKTNALAAETLVPSSEGDANLEIETNQTKEGLNGVSDTVPVAADAPPHATVATNLEAHDTANADGIPMDTSNEAPNVQEKAASNTEDGMDSQEAGSQGASDTPTNEGNVAESNDGDGEDRALQEVDRRSNNEQDQPPKKRRRKPEPIKVSRIR